MSNLWLTFTYITLQHSTNNEWGTLELNIEFVENEQ